MGTFGELFPGPKLRKESSDEEGSGELEDTGPLDLDSGVIRLRRKPSQQPSAQPDEPEDR